jgi:hypothetical protein
MAQLIENKPPRRALIATLLHFCTSAAPFALRWEPHARRSNRASACSGPPALGCSPSRDPFEKALHAGALTPHQGEELARVEIGGVLPEESLHAPADVERPPRREPVSFGDNPVVVQRVQHRSGVPASGRAPVRASERASVLARALTSRRPGDSTIAVRKKGFR